MSVKTKTFTLALTKDELTVLQYLVATNSDEWGDPLKDIYEVGDDEPEDPYQALATAAAKVKELSW